MKNYTILIVDDIIINRMLLVEIVEEIGANYLEAANGREAIRLLQARNDIDLVLLDIEMPLMNGFDTLRQIRSKFTSPKKNIPIVAITAHDPNTFIEDFKNTGFNHLITKPYTVEKLHRIIVTLLEP